MQKTYSIWLLMAVCSLQPICATPLQRSDVPAEPAWVLHLDWDALRPTAIGQYLLAELNKPEAQAKFAAFETIFSFDPRKQLHGLTVYSTGKAQEDGVLLVYADFDPGPSATLAKGAHDYQNATHNQHVIHNWIDDKKKAKNGVKPRIYAAIQGNKVVVFGQQQARVAEALDVLDRVTPSLGASAVFHELGSPHSGNYVEAAARKMDFSSSDPHAAILRLAQVIRLQIGEVGAQNHRQPSSRDKK